MGLAEHVASWSKDPSTKVGAVVANHENHIISLGYNGLPRGIEDRECRLNQREIKYKMVVHAELNALIFGAEKVRGCTLYIWPFLPCSSCTGVLINAGIKRVVTKLPELNPRLERWQSDFDVSLTLLAEAGVYVDYVHPEVDNGDTVR